MSTEFHRGEAVDAFRRIRALPIWHEPPDVERFPGGRTNQNFRVVADGRTWFARVGVDLPHHGIRREHEAYCSRFAAAAGIAPPVLFADNGVMVVEFVAGKPLVQGEPVDPSTIDRLAAILRRLHEAPVPADLAPFDPIAASRRYLEMLRPGTLIDSLIDRIHGILDGAPRLTPRTLIHGDLIPENVILADDRLWLVDWEYAGYGDPAVDLALAMTHFGLSEFETNRFVAAYGEIDLTVARALQPIVAVREALWCEVQIEVAGAQGDLIEYRTLCWRRIGVDR